MGVWIETKSENVLIDFPYVAPYVGAWIETTSLKVDPRIFKSHPTWVRGLKPKFCLMKLKQEKVAPYVGAWIETTNCL